ncbi:unnamed protein product, partial [Prorocentrum cordatum]
CSMSLPASLTCGHSPCAGAPPGCAGRHKDAGTPRRRARGARAALLAPEARGRFPPPSRPTARVQEVQAEGPCTVSPVAVGDPRRRRRRRRRRRWRRRRRRRRGRQSPSRKPIRGGLSPHVGPPPSSAPSGGEGPRAGEPPSGPSPSHSPARAATASPGVWGCERLTKTQTTKASANVTFPGNRSDTAADVAWIKAPGSAVGHS